MIISEGITMIRIEVIENNNEKKRISRVVLESLPEWFGIESAREKYIEDSAEQTMIAAFDGEKEVGFICLNETGGDTVELHVLGVLKEYHHKGIGSKLFKKARKIAAASGYSFIQVKTVAMGKYPEYDATNKFYLSLGFKEFEVIPELWGEENPCQIYVMLCTPSGSVQL